LELDAEVVRSLRLELSLRLAALSDLSLTAELAAEADPGLRYAPPIVDGDAVRYEGPK
jgi:hypothetical protein